MSRVRKRLEQYKAEIEKTSQYKQGLPGSALDIVNALLLVLKEDEESTATDQEAINAINTISRYCNCSFCSDCAIRKICEKYFDKIGEYPSEWPEVESNIGGRGDI